MLTGIIKEDILKKKIEDGLVFVNKKINNRLKNKNKEINEMCNLVKTYKGKLLRPTLTLICDQLVGGSGKSEVTSIAASIEMIHLATLIHDDVLDKSEKRRGNDSVFFLSGTEKAIMFGDWLLSNAYHLCSEVNMPKLNIKLGEVTNSLCEGQILQLCSRGEKEISIDQYNNFISKKTASLISASCELGVMASGGSKETQESVKTFAHHIGMAFQIVDDILDFLGDEKTLGKKTGVDITQGEWSLPLVVFQSIGGFSKEDSVFLHKDNPRVLVEKMKKHGVFKYCQNEADEHIKKALNCLNHIEKNEWSCVLIKISKMITERKK